MNRTKNYITAGDLLDLLEACPRDARIALATSYVTDKYVGHGLEDVHPEIGVRCIDLDEHPAMQEKVERDLDDTYKVRQLVVLG